MENVPSFRRKMSIFLTIPSHLNVPKAVRAGSQTLSFRHVSRGKLHNNMCMTHNDGQRLPVISKIWQIFTC